MRRKKKDPLLSQVQKRIVKEWNSPVISDDPLHFFTVIFPGALLIVFMTIGIHAMSIEGNGFISVAMQISIILALAVIGIKTLPWCISLIYKKKQKKQSNILFMFIFLGFVAAFIYTVSYLLVMFIVGSLIFIVPIYRDHPLIAFILSFLFLWLLWKLHEFERFVEYRYHLKPFAPLQA